MHPKAMLLIYIALKVCDALSLWTHVERLNYI
jgi:hypothetical protein